MAPKGSEAPDYLPEGWRPDAEASGKSTREMADVAYVVAIAPGVYIDRNGNGTGDPGKAKAFSNRASADRFLEEAVEPAYPDACVKALPATVTEANDWHFVTIMGRPYDPPPKDKTTKDAYISGLYGHRCAYCGRYVGTTKREGLVTVPFNPGDDSPANLVPCCTPCRYILQYYPTPKQMLERLRENVRRIMVSSGYAFAVDNGSPGISLDAATTELHITRFLRERARAAKKGGD